MSRTLLHFLPVALLAGLFGCGGGRGISLDGYSWDMLNGKRISTLLPDRSNQKIENPESFAFARGIVPVSAGDMLENEIRMHLIPAIDRTLDSNHVTLFIDQPAGQVVPIGVDQGLENGTPVKWDLFARAAREGGIDYFIAITSLTIVSRPNPDRGEEGATIVYSLLDPLRSKVMTNGVIVLDPVPLIAPPESYNRIAVALAERLPFHLSEHSR